jgi:hypothetical protein
MIAFDELLARLAAAKVAFVVVGGLAVLKAGFLRVTEDIDLLVEADADNLKRFLAAIEPFSPAAATLSPDDFPLEEGALRFTEDFDVDVFTLMSGHTYADLVPRSDQHQVLGQPVRFLGREGLILLKQDSLRPKDRIDVEALRRLGAS